jgi:uncharacterized protein YehS (DUF1456 family)
MTHDFKAALEGYERANNNGDLTTWLTINKDLFLRALRIADRLQSGDLNKILGQGIAAQSSDMKHRKLCEAAQMIKEVE